MNIVGVYKEIQDQHMNIVRTLYSLSPFSSEGEKSEIKTIFHYSNPSVESVLC